MKVFRFMSREEFKKFNTGEVLYNNTRHNAKTSSVGFCFFDLKDYKPHEAIHFLSGLVSFNICAVFEVDKSKLRQSWGIYHKIKEPVIVGNLLIDLLKAMNSEEHFTATEYCTSEYSNRDFKLIRYSEDIWGQYDTLEKQKELKWREV